jgi:hypothetical protein
MASRYLRFILLAFLASLPVQVTAADDDVKRGGDYFATGGIVKLQEPVEGDALLAGGTVESSASIGGDATIAGGRVSLHAVVGDDLYLAGGQVEVDALVKGNARVAGGRVRIAPESRIEGGVTVAGGTVSASGTFGRYLTLAGGDVELSGHVRGDVHVYADELTIGPGTRIDGRLICRTAKPVAIPPDAEIAGGLAQGNGEVGGGDEGLPWRREREGVGWFWLAGLALVGFLLLRLFPSFSARTTAALTGNPWLGIGLGFLVLVGVPAAVLILLLTVIGIPLAVMGLLSYLAMLVAAYVLGAQHIGDRLLAATRPAIASRVAWRIAALVLVLLGLAFLGMVPVIGSLLRFLVLLLGLGALALTFVRRPRPDLPAPA